MQTENGKRFGSEIDQTPETKRYRKRIMYLNAATRILAATFIIVFIMNIIATYTTRCRYNEATASYLIDRYNNIFSIYYICYVAALVAVYIAEYILMKKQLKFIDRFYADKMDMSDEDLTNLRKAFDEATSPKMLKLSDEEYKKRLPEILAKYGLDKDLNPDDAIDKEETDNKDHEDEDR